VSAISVAPPPARAPWYEAKRVRRIAATLLAAMVVAEGVVAIFLRQNDWEGHRQVGIIARTQGLVAVPWPWYSLGRVAFDAAISLLPRVAGRALCYGLAVAALWACFRMWDRMVDARTPQSSPIAWAAGLVTLLATFTVWQRDFDDCGLHLFLLFFISAAGWSLTRRRHALAGLSLAVAVVYKTSPILLLPFLLWKRQWRATLWTLGLIAGLSVAPALLFGWRASIEYHRRTLETVLSSAAERDPSRNPIQESPNLQNQALGPAIARYVETHGPGDPLYSPHPAFVQFGDLGPDGAHRVVTVATCLLLGAIAWRTRRACATSGQWAMEWGAVTILPILLAPVCWKQHLVVMLPAVFLVARHQLLHPRPRGRTLVLWTIAALTLFSAPDGPLGRDLAALLASYKTFTIAALLALVSVLTLDGSRPPETAAHAG
jgi:hypothetical protein